jgi:hypothetical protein
MTLTTEKIRFKSDIESVYRTLNNDLRRGRAGCVFTVKYKVIKSPFCRKQEIEAFTFGKYFCITLVDANHG